MEDICIDLYVLKRYKNLRHILETVMSMQTQFRRVFRKKQRRVELNSVGYFVAKTVLVKVHVSFHWKNCVGHSTA